MRRHIAVFAIIILFISLFNAKLAFAGAWTVPKHHVWLQEYVKWNYSKDTFNDKRRLNSGTDNAKGFRSWEIVQEQQLEFGVTDWLTFHSALEYKEAHYKEYDRRVDWGPYTRKNHGITNVKLGARWRITDKPVVFSIQPKFSIYPGYGIDHGDDPDFNRNQPSIGYGDNAFEIKAMVGKAFNLPIEYKIPCYVGAETGYRWRTRAVCHDIPYFIEGGFWPKPWLLLKTELDGYIVNPGTGSIKSDYGIWRVGAVYQVFGDSVLREGDKMFNIEFQYGMTLWGKNTNAAQEWIVKIQTQF